MYTGNTMAAEMIHRHCKCLTRPTTHKALLLVEVNL